MRKIRIMITEIITVGTEIILGDIQNGNARYLAEKLTELGFDIHYISTVGDNRKRIHSLLKTAMNRVDIVLVTGGLGPTDDDLTRESISEVTGRKLVFHPDISRLLKDYFQARNYQFTENNLKQAYLPEGAFILDNKLGTAPGILLETGNCTIIAMPGVPREMKKMFDSNVKPYLLAKNSEIIRSKVLNFFSIGESILETKLKDILEKQKNPTYALLAGTGEVKIRITAKGSSQEEVYALIKEAEGEIKERVGDYLYAYNDEGLAAVVGKLLSENKQTIALAESCTGGLIGNRITDIPGSSDYFTGGIVVYSNQAKINQLQVKEKTLAKYGAVSKETAKEMAENIRRIMNSDLGISVTGIAGPGGGTKEKPVGTVYIGLAAETNTEIQKLNLSGNREWNKWMSSQYALYSVYKFLKK